MSDRLDRFLQAYIAAALWSSNDESTPDGGVPIDQNHGPEDLDPKTLEGMKKDCQAFLDANAADIVDENVIACRTDFDALERAGHDFWLNRNGHGCGFWDGDWAEPAATRLDKAARAFGEVHLYVENDVIFSE